MAWTSWVRRWLENRARKSRTTGRPVRRKPALGLEALEDRTLFAVGVLSTAAFPAGSNPASATANGQSEVAPSHSVSDDGRYVVFVSTADNIVPGQVDTQTVQDVFLRDTVAGTTRLVSHTATSPTTTANGRSVNAVISGDGSTVVFYSFATNLVAGQTFSGTGRSALYLYEVPTGNVKLVSHTLSSPTQAGSATYPTVPGTPGGSPYVNSLAYSTPGGGLALPSVSHNGQYIAYISNAKDLVGSDVGNGSFFGRMTNAYLYTRATSANTLISHRAGSSTLAGDGWVSTVSLSADGSTVAFTSPATNHISGLTVRNNGSDELYVWSRITNAATGMSAGQLRLASHAASNPTVMATVPGSFFFGFTADAPPSLSSNGNYIAYYYAGSDLVAEQGGTPSVLNVFRYTVNTNTNELVTHIHGNNAIAGDNPPNRIAPGAVGPSEATGPAISADGRFIAFANNSSNLLATPLVGQDGQDNVYLYDATTQANTLVSHAAGSLTTALPNGGTAPSISANGRYVAFIDLAYPATDPETWGSTTTTAYARRFDRLAADPTAAPEILGGAIDPNTSKIIASAILAPTVMSADGGTVVWDGNASNVVANDLNDNLDVFRWVPGGVTNQPPVLTPIADQTVNEGGTVTLTASASDPDSGQTLTFSLVSGPAGASIHPTTGVFNWTAADGPATASVTVRVTDSGSPALSDTRTFTINVLNVAPTAGITGPAGGSTGQALNFTLTANDPSAPDRAAGFTYTIDWGDGSPTQTVNATPGNGSGVSVNHVFAEAGSYTVQVTATDKDGDSGSASRSLTITAVVENQPPVLTPIDDQMVDEGGSLTFTASASDPDSGQTLTFSLVSGPAGASIHPTTGVFNWTAADGPATASVTVRVTDSGSPALSDTRTFTINVLNVAPTAGVTGPAGGSTGQALNFTLTANDPSAPDRAAGFTYTIDWGDGSPTQTVNATPGNGSGVSANHVFAQAGSYTVQITATDKDGGSGSASHSLTITAVVENQPPVLTPIDDQMVDEGGSLTFTASASDPDMGQTLTFTLVSGPAGASIDPMTGVFNWTAADGPASAPVTVRVTDNGSPALSDTRTFTITVLNVAPTAGVTGPASGTTGQPLSFTVSASDLSAADQAAGFTYVIDWGDGSPTQTVNATPGNGSGVSVNHVFAEAGSYTVQVTASDKDGDSGQATHTVAVAVPVGGLDVNWSGGGITAPAPVNAGAAFTIDRTFTVSGDAAPRPFQISYIASVDAIFGNEDDMLLGVETIADPADRSVGTHAGRSPSLQIASQGVYYLFALLDSAGELSEDDEGNNLAQAIDQLVVSGIGV